MGEAHVALSMLLLVVCGGRIFVLLQDVEKLWLNDSVVGAVPSKE